MRSQAITALSQRQESYPVGKPVSAIFSTSLVHEVIAGRQREGGHWRCNMRNGMLPTVDAGVTID